MPNYLDESETIVEGAWEVKSTKKVFQSFNPAENNSEWTDDRTSKTKSNGKNVDNSYWNNPTDAGDWGMQGPGSRPMALHTEYAEGTADWGAAYHGDVIFYLIRADAGGEQDPGAFMVEANGVDLDLAGRGIPGREETQGYGLPDALGSANGGTLETNMATAGVNIQTGPRSVRHVQTAVNQVAVGAFLDKAVPSAVAVKALAGPMTGIHDEIEIPMNVKTQASAARQTINDSIRNLTNIVDDLASDVIITSLPASEIFFYNSLHHSFNPDTKVEGGTRSPEEILRALTYGAVGELSFYLAEASGGIRSTRNLIQSINKGDVGYTTSMSQAQSERYGPMGLESRYSR